MQQRWRQQRALGNSQRDSVNSVNVHGPLSDLGVKRAANGSVTPNEFSIFDVIICTWISRTRSSLQVLGTIIFFTLS